MNPYIRPDILRQFAPTPTVVSDGSGRVFCFTGINRSTTTYAVAAIAIKYSLLHPCAKIALVDAGSSTEFERLEIASVLCPESPCRLGDGYSLGVDTSDEDFFYVNSCTWPVDIVNHFPRNIDCYFAPNKTNFGYDFWEQLLGELKSRYDIIIVNINMDALQKTTTVPGLAPAFVYGTGCNNKLYFLITANEDNCAIAREQCKWNRITEVVCTVYPSQNLVEAKKAVSSLQKELGSRYLGFLNMMTNVYFDEQVQRGDFLEIARRLENKQVDKLFGHPHLIDRF